MIIGYDNFNDEVQKFGVAHFKTFADVKGPISKYFAIVGEEDVNKFPKVRVSGMIFTQILFTENLVFGTNKQNVELIFDATLIIWFASSVLSKHPMMSSLFNH